MAMVRRMLECGVLLAALLSLYALVRVSDYYQSELVYLYDPTTTGAAANLGGRRRRRVVFVPFPYRSLASGEDAQCRWTTKHVDANGTPHLHDPIQLAAYREGVCIPDKLNSTLHVFSTAEAIECLNSTEQGRNISVAVSGDSYNRQLFIGLADILLGDLSGEEIKTSDRRRALLAKSNERLAALRGNDPSFPDVQFPMDCFGECYGDYNDTIAPVSAPFSVRCSGCINNFTRRSEDSVGVVGAGAHNLRYFGVRARVRAKREGAEGAALPTVLHHTDKAIGETAEAVNDTIRDFEQFFHLANNTIYVSMPSYQIEKVPLPYRNASHSTHAGRIYDGLLPSLAPRDRSHPFVDVFQLTKACHMDNCSYDGGHRSRYVNRWKAQLLLNTLCEVRDG